MDLRRIVKVDRITQLDGKQMVVNSFKYSRKVTNESKIDLTTVSKIIFIQNLEKSLGS